jgi:hypothetical protein
MEVGGHSDGLAQIDLRYSYRPPSWLQFEARLGLLVLHRRSGCETMAASAENSGARSIRDPAMRGHPFAFLAVVLT